MTYENSTGFHIPEQYYTALFEALPGNSVLVLNDAPRFTIVAATPAYLKQTGYTKEAVIGKGVFEDFPSNSTDPNYTGANDLLLSYQHVIQHKEPHFLPVQRYDLQNMDGSFTEKYWRIANMPVLTPEGAVAYVIHTAEDITEKVKAEKKEHNTKGIEKAFRLFMQAPVAICIVSGAEHLVELANEQMLQVLGRTRKMVGKPIAQTLTEAKEQGLIDILNQVYATGQSFHAPVFPAELLINGEREKRYFDLVFQPYFEGPDDLKPASIFCIAYNITQQILSQKKVEESEYRFRTLIEKASVATGLYIGKDFVVQYANDILLSYWGKDSSVIGKPLREALPELEGQPFLGYLDRVYTTGEPYVSKEEKASLIVDGRLQDFYFNFTYQALRDKDGSIYGIHNMAIDVTKQVVVRQKLEENQQELQLAIDAADLGIFRLNLLTNEATNDQKVDEWYGYTLQGYSKAEGFNPIHPEDRDRVDEAILATLKSVADSRHDITYRVVHPKTGALRHLRSFGKTMFNDQGQPYQVIGIIQDITAQAQQQEALKKSEAMLQTRVLERTLELENLNQQLLASNANLEQFAYAASHDLKEPIRKIHTFSERLKTSLGERLTEHEKHYFSRMELASKRMASLIDDLLLYSEVSQATVIQEPVDLNFIIDCVLNDLDLEIEQKGATIRVDKLFTIKGHPRQLQQVFQNLISNALKYSKSDVAPVITITCSKVRGAGAGAQLAAEELGKEYYLVTVADNGIGFDQEDASRIFNVFTRLHGMTEYKGTGVGLSIVRRVIEGHKGYVWAESTPGEGAFFKILLPVK